MLATHMAINPTQQVRQLFGRHTRIVALLAGFLDICRFDVGDRVALHQIIGHAVADNLAAV